VPAVGMYQSSAACSRILLPARPCLAAILVVIQDARLYSGTSRGAEAAHPEGDGALVVRVEAGHAASGGAPCSAADGGGPMVRVEIVKAGWTEQ
jgi:hypothetical protein